jgi:hypothetical protein
LRQRILRTVFGNGVVSVDDSRATGIRIDSDLEQIEQIPRPEPASAAQRADDPDMIRVVAYQVLLEACAVVGRLRQVSIPDGGRIILARGGRAVVDEVHRTVVRCDPRKDRSCGGRDIDDYSGRPCDSLIVRAGEGNSVPVGPGGVELAVSRVDRQGWKDVI